MPGVAGKVGGQPDRCAGRVQARQVEERGARFPAKAGVTVNGRQGRCARPPVRRRRAPLRPFTLLRRGKRITRCSIGSERTRKHGCERNCRVRRSVVGAMQLSTDSVIGSRRPRRVAVSRNAGPGAPAGALHRRLHHRRFALPTKWKKSSTSRRPFCQQGGVRFGMGWKSSLANTPRWKRRCGSWFTPGAGRSRASCRYWHGGERFSRLPAGSVAPLTGRSIQRSVELFAGVFESARAMSQNRN